MQSKILLVSAFLSTISGPLFAEFPEKEATRAPRAHCIGSYAQMQLETVFAGFMDGKLAKGDIHKAVAAHHGQGILVTNINPDLLPHIQKPSTEKAARYMHGDKTDNYVLMGTGDGKGPGGNYIVAKPESVGWNDPNRYHVPPHTHLSDHLTVVLNGQGMFVCEVGGHWVRVEVKPGSIVFIPKGMRHTFWAGWGIEVASFSEVHYDVTNPKFAKKLPEEPIIIDREVKPRQ